MFPILLDLSRLKIMLVGNGRAAERRLKLLDADAEGAERVTVFSSNPSPELLEIAGKRLIRRLPIEADFSGVSAVMIADFPLEQSAELYDMAKRFGIIANVEDNKKYCDFHVPAIVRRGDFLVTVSTGGASPRLAKRVRQILEKIFPAEWGDKVKELGILRNGWRKAGDDMKMVAKKTDDWLQENSLLENICKVKNSK